MPHVTTELLEYYLRLEQSHLGMRGVGFVIDYESLEPDLTNDSDPDEERIYTYFLGTMILLLIFFFGVGACVEHFKPRIGHETSATLILGIIISCVLWAIVTDEYTDVWQFDAGIFFNFFLPPIIFNSGFNMRKKRFFANLGNIALFGLVVTLLCFLIYSALFWIIISQMSL